MGTTSAITLNSSAQNIGVKRSEKVIKIDDDKTAKTKMLIRSSEAATLADLRSYLSSSVFYDVGPVTARKIVKVFGVKTAQVIETTPNELLTVKGVGKKRASSIKNGWSLQRRLIAESAELVKLKLVQ